MLAKTDAPGADVIFGETCPGGDSRARTVGAHDEAGMECLAIGVDESPFDRAGDALDGVFPVKADTKTGGAFEQDLMEDCAPDAAPRSLRKGCLCGGMFADEADALDGVAFEAVEIFLDINADCGESLEGVRQETFAAGFVDGRLDGVDEIDLKTVAG